MPNQHLTQQLNFLVTSRPIRVIEQIARTRIIDEAIATIGSTRRDSQHV